MNENQVFLVNDVGNVICEEVGEKSYHDYVLAKLFQEEVDKEFKIDERIYSDNASEIVSRYHYLVVFETKTDVVAMFPKNATIEQKVLFYNHFYGKNQNNPIPKKMNVAVRIEDTWDEVDNTLEYLNNFETNIGGRK